MPRYSATSLTPHSLSVLLILLFSLSGVSRCRSCGAAFLAQAGAVFAGAGGGCGGELGVGGGVPADPGQRQVADDEGGVVVGVGPRADVVAFAPVGAGGALIFAAGGAQVFVAGGVAAALGGEVAAEAEHVGPA